MLLLQTQSMSGDGTLLGAVTMKAVKAAYARVGLMPGPVLISGQGTQVEGTNLRSAKMMT